MLSINVLFWSPVSTAYFVEINVNPRLDFAGMRPHDIWAMPYGASEMRIHSHLLKQRLIGAKSSVGMPALVFLEIKMPIHIGF